MPPTSAADAAAHAQAPAADAGPDAPAWDWQGQVAGVEARIRAKGEAIREGKAAGNPPSDADVNALLSLKHEYLQLTGDYYVAPGERRQHRGQRALRVDPLAPPLPPSAFPPYAPRGYFRFEVVHRSRKPGSRARVGRIVTPHGVIDTPCFVPVGTNGALKGVPHDLARAAGMQLMFCNTYHLLVHPGPDVVGRAGGLHRFMHHPTDLPLITDSGGFQVFSLADANAEEEGPELKSRRKRNRDAETGEGTVLDVSERGVRFRSYLDQREIFLSPESTVDAQKRFGADIIVPLDELPPYHVTPERLDHSVRLSHRWMARSLRRHLQDPRGQAMYGVVHGGTDRDLRRLSAAYLASLPFDGFAIGGSLGQDRAEMLDLLDYLVPLLPADKPNHLLGIADDESAAKVVPLGVDTFDSCNPTRLARHGTLYTSAGPIRIAQRRHEDDHGPVDPSVETIPHSRAYLHHLFRQHEPNYVTLASVHNIAFMQAMTKRMREQILRDEL